MIDIKQMNWEWIIQKNLQNLSIFQAQQQALSFGWATHHLDVSDQGFHDPFSFFDSSKRQTLQPFFLAKYQMIGANHQKITFQFLVDFVFHPMSKKGKALILV